MKCILMNKNTEVLVAEYNTVSKFFDRIIEVKNIDYAPYILKSFYIKMISMILLLEQIYQSGLEEEVFLLGEIN